MERLRDGQVKLGAARYEKYAGSQRLMVNQIRTGTVSHHTLLNVLERRSEHLCVCFVCKDNNLSTNHYSVLEKQICFVSVFLVVIHRFQISRCW
jgi:hypothetical protein